MNNNKVLVSVIVPIYKVEQYLDACVKSIQEQTYKNLEIILVDDGSPDNCPVLCDEYAEKDERIKVIHKKNGGLSDARNAGIKVATGKYIYCVDSDDMIEPVAIEVAVERAEQENADIVITTVKKPSNKFDVIVGNGEEMFKIIFDRYCWEAWGKLILKDLVFDMEFPVGKLFEDLGYVPYAVLRSKKVIFVDDGMYLYTIRDNSIMGNAAITLSSDLVDIVGGIVEYVRKKHAKLLAFILAFSIEFLFTKSMSIKNIHNETNDKFLHRVREYYRHNFRFIITSFSIGPRMKLKVFFLVVFNVLI